MLGADCAIFLGPDMSPYSLFPQKYAIKPNKTHVIVTRKMCVKNNCEIPFHFLVQTFGLS